MVDIIFQVVVFALCTYAIIARWGVPACRAIDRRFSITERLPHMWPRFRADPKADTRLLTSLFLQQAAVEVRQPIYAQAEDDPTIPHRIEIIEPDPEPDDDDEDEDEPDEDDDSENEPEFEGEEVEATASTPSPAIVYVTARPQHLVVDGPAANALVAVNRMSAWVTWMLRVLRKAIHLIVIGQSGAGKTTALQVFVETLVIQGIAVVVCDPDAAAGDWPGTQVFGAGDDFDGITRALKAVQTMARTRRQARATGQRTFDEFWFIVDEYAEIKDECAIAGTVIEGGLRRWRKLNMHLVIGIQDTQAKTMGFERRTSLLNNARIVNIKLGAGDVRTATTEGEPAIIIPMLEPQRGPVAEPTESEEALPSEVGLAFVMPNPALDPDESEDDEEDEGGIELEGKDAQIAGMLRDGRSYGEIATALHVATTRISRVKRDIGIG